jgi:hypothetical protein
VNPSDVPIPNRIERHPDTYRLVFEAYLRNEKGDLYPNADLTGAASEICVVQLEGPPLPFP